MALFVKQNIILHSGQKSDFKIECDNLTNSDVETLCYLISKKIKFFNVLGVPRGGIKFAQCLKQYRSENPKYPCLIVDDVFTSGKSMEKFVKHQGWIKDPIGVVIFSRGKCPDWITPLFQMW